MAVAALVALVIAFLVVRAALERYYLASAPAKLGKIWPGHPQAVLRSGLAEVGDRAVAGRPIDPALVHRLLIVSTKAPLAPEPFLVRGVQAQLAGDRVLAERAFLAARERAPRLIAARYLLADVYLRTGQTRKGLGEVSALSRLVPGSLNAVAPYLAAFARSPASAAEVKEMIRRQPALETALLTELAKDASNLKLILYLWTGRGGDGAKNWQGGLVNALVAAGRYGEARQAWSRFTGIARDDDRLVDPNFASSGLAPFSWTLAVGAAGVAEPEQDGRLHILYYGRDDLLLASQLLTLTPGAYRLSMQVAGASPAARSLSWTISCTGADRHLAAVGLDTAGKGGSLTASFAVPSGCPAQSLQLNGKAPEFPQQVELSVTQLKLVRAGV